MGIYSPFSQRDVNRKAGSPDACNCHLNQKGPTLQKRPVWVLTPCLRPWINELQVWGLINAIRSLAAAYPVTA